MQSSSIPFTVWSLRTDLPWLDDEPGMIEAWLDSVSVHYGQPFGEGPGAIVTSYDPQPAFVYRERREGGQRLETMMRGPLALGRAMAVRFAEVRPRQESLAPVRDVVVQCGRFLVPAMELGIGMREATVIVSADLLCHPVVLGLWRWYVEMPLLNEVSFE